MTIKSNKLFKIMKKLLLTLSAVAVLGLAANAQTEKGKFMVGGQVSFDGTKVKDTDIKTNSFSIVPNAGYFVADNIAVGTGIGYNWSKSEIDNLKETTNSSFVLAPFGRLYSKNDGPVKFFGQLSVPMSWGTLEEEGTKTATTANYGVELAPGIAYFPTSNIGVEFKVRGLFYNNSSVTEESTDTKVTTDTYGLNVNSLAPTVGVTFHF